MKLFTQNIDTLERLADIPADKLVEAHGSFAHHHCIQCKSEYPEQRMKEAIGKHSVPRCEISECNGLVKPDIVFFGEALPAAFHQNRSLPTEADLCIVMGTSLTVQPFASLPNLCYDDVPRLLINLERVGGIGSRADDVLLLEDCDTGVQKLAAALGWQGELESIWKEATLGTECASEFENGGHEFHEDNLDLLVATLTGEIDHSLKISNGHANMLREHLQDKQELWASKAPDIARNSEKAAGSTMPLAPPKEICNDSSILPVATIAGGKPVPGRSDLCK